MIEGIVNDTRYALRSIAKAPVFTATVVLTLALGIGGNTAVFSVLNAVLLKPLPYPNPHELVRIYLTYRGADNFLPGPAVIDVRDRSRSLDVAALYTYNVEGVDLTDGPQPERVRQLHVSADYFRVMGVRMILGGPFERPDERPDGRVAVVSARIWQEYLGGSL